MGAEHLTRERLDGIGPDLHEPDPGRRLGWLALEVRRDLHDGHVARSHGALGITDALQARHLDEVVVGLDERDRGRL